MTKDGGRNTLDLDRRVDVPTSRREGGVLVSLLSSAIIHSVQRSSIARRDLWKYRPDAMIRT